MESTFEFLRFVQSKDLSFWDVKSYLGTSICSQFVVIKLKDYLIEQNKKEKLSKYPDEYFKILGVNNQNGLFDAYEEQGKNINQPYKKVENGWFAYNPYRVNVGSIGLKSAQQNNEYISPAYVVFSCKDALLPDYLNVIIKTKFFNEAIKANTTGSVRQTLGFNNLCNIEIPLPSIEKQKELVAQYDALLNLAKDKENQADTMEQSIDDYLMAELGIKENLQSTSNSLFQIGEYKVLSNWDIKTLEKNQNFLSSSKYSTYKCSQILSINPCTVLPSDKNTEISFIPMENVSDAYGKVMRLDKKNVTKAKGYTKFKNGDLIWAKITPCMQNGKSAVLDNLLNGYGYGSTEFYVIRNDKITEKLNTNFLHLLLRMKLVLNEAMKTFTGACGQQRVPVRFIKELQIPLPPLSIQHRILEEVTFRKEQIKSLREESEKLRLQAISDFEKEVFN